ncbi:MAG: oxygen-dependent coproporphyrinogen oxidase [Bacteroidetes bacterium]|jgi:coproporphyrinogen III oxidase|nr:oxygen-dependent coproporphyrinogen oxidase [Bacteroidota bacterium]
MRPDKFQIESDMKSLQDLICSEVEQLDGEGKFVEDKWSREAGGGGRTRTISGRIIEKGGVNFSAVHGETPDKILKALQLEKSDFFATGVSIVLHPYHPFIPIIHMNVRYFEMSNGIYWFGGGVDVTPHYIDMKAAIAFHKSVKELCDSFDKSFYTRFKDWADNYFYIPHRRENRGIGGIFFDRLDHKTEHLAKSDLLQFVLEVGRQFVPLYTPFVEENINKEYTDRNKNWQYHRRGRYVEFNLVWDKGTKFGLDTGGRTESILMSLPPKAAWTYDKQILPNSQEEKTQKILAQGAFPLDKNSK